MRRAVATVVAIAALLASAGVAAAAWRPGGGGTARAAAATLVKPAISSATCGGGNGNKVITVSFAGGNPGGTSFELYVRKNGQSYPASPSDTGTGSPLAATKLSAGSYLVEVRGVRGAWGAMSDEKSVGC